VEHGVVIPIELETSYLHFKTNSEVGSKDRTRIWYYDKEGTRDAGGIEIVFTYRRVEYKLWNCQWYDTPFPLTLPTTVNKVWTIEKRGYRTRVFCNGVLVLDITLSNRLCDKTYLEMLWEREVSEIKFHSLDRASEQYRIGQ
jgi:hypothetical protein